MTIKQISVFLENKSGRLAEVLNILGREKITVHALSIADTSDYGILRLVTGDDEKTLKVLTDKDFTAKLTDVIGIVSSNEAGSLSNFLQTLADDAISVEYMYGFGIGNTAAIILKPENMEIALDILRSYNFKLISNKELANL